MTNNFYTIVKMEETEKCTQHEQMLQGDIIKFATKNSYRPFDLAIVINADCDMENGKHDGVLAILPIYRFSEYLNKFWVPAYLSTQAEEMGKIIKSACELNDNNLDELKRWIMQPPSKNSFIAENFIEKFAFDKKKKASVLDAFSKLIIILTAQDNPRLELLGHFAPNDSEEKHSKYIKKQINSALTSMGDGHFYISEIKADEDIGYVVRMRRIYSIDARSVFKSFSEQQSRLMQIDDSAYRVCKLSPYYKFKVAQLFAMQFSRIGLPNELTGLSELAIENVANTIKFIK